MVNIQSKDHLYDLFLREPTKDKFLTFIHQNYGEMNDLDFKEQWIEREHLAKTMLAMANSGGGIIIFGIKEENNSIIPEGITNFKDKADIDNELSSLIPRELEYEVLNYNYDSDAYGTIKDKKFQIIYIHYTPELLPFISLNTSKKFTRDTIYVRRGTKCEVAHASEIKSIINKKIRTIYTDSSNLSLQEHLSQLKELYNELPKKIQVLIRKGEPSTLSKTLTKILQNVQFASNSEYEEQDNPNYPKESYEAFISHMIEQKKLKIEKVLDLK